MLGFLGRKGKRRKEEFLIRGGVKERVILVECVCVCMYVYMCKDVMDKR